MEVFVFTAFAVLVALICVDDFIYYRISNRYVVAAIGLYVFGCLFGAVAIAGIINTLFCACACFTLLLAMNHMDCVGGGDVKLIFAMALWVGADRIYQYGLAVTVVGLITIIPYALFPKWINSARNACARLISQDRLIQLLITKTRMYHPKNTDFFKLEIPYGIPLALGAIWIVFSYR